MAGAPLSLHPHAFPTLQGVVTRGVGVRVGVRVLLQAMVAWRVRIMPLDPTPQTLRPESNPPKHKP